jgi:excinuclease ABC subunit A
MMGDNKEPDGLDFITVANSREHNLKGVSLRIPLNRLTLVCGVSGSGKSTLAHDVLCSEGQGRFLESFSAYARLFQARQNRSRTDAIGHIPPALALGQRLSLNNPRSTVCTLTDLQGPLRMLFSRFAAADGGGEKITRSHLSFNHALGACPACQGLGRVHEIDTGSLITDENRSLRQGALSLSTPNGYIIYSQVTLDALDQVCRAHGFSVDVPWKDLSAEQKQVVLYGSDRVQIPFGKHPLASRLKWTGITPKPRGLGIYRGIVPVMAEVLSRDPNPNILRYCRQRPCPACTGLRLKPRALELNYRGTRLRALLSGTVAQLAAWGEKEAADPGRSRAEKLLLTMLAANARRLSDLSLGHLVLTRSVPSLSRSEGQRIQVANLLRNPISGMLYVLDEPGSGLHAEEKKPLYRRLGELVSVGGTVVMVSHDPQALPFADWVVELGPGGGTHGGRLLFSGSREEFLARPKRPEAVSPASPDRPQRGDRTALGRKPAPGWFSPRPAQGELKELDAVRIPAESISVISGLSGSGKTTLLERFSRLDARRRDGEPPLRRTILVDQEPLGRNARSNPATYTKIFDDIRKLFAAQPGAKKLGLSASSFSFNTEQGCCPNCQGAGVIEITMHYMQSLFQTCPQCQGRRYMDRVLEFRHQGLAIDEVLELTVDQGLAYFAAEPRIGGQLKVLSELGLGYLTLGQPSSTLSGGEAQRVRLASFIQAGRAAGSLYLLDEPCMGLHDRDVPFLVRALKSLCRQRATVLVAENNPRFIAACDWLVELPGPGLAGDRLFCGQVGGARQQEGSRVAALLSAGTALPSGSGPADGAIPSAPAGPAFIHLRGVRTHNLKNIDVTIPERSFTVVSGPSGSGKSSLVLDTLYKACLRRYAELLSPYLRDRLSLAGASDCDEIVPYKPAVALSARYLEATPRSTVGTLSGVHDTLRLLFSRVGGKEAGLHASHFSFNHHDGACTGCNGLGHVFQADITRWLVDPDKSILDGAFSSAKKCQFFLDRNGRFLAILQAAARELDIDVSRKWRDLSPEVQALILEGTPGTFNVNWEFQRGRRRGEHRFSSEWAGFNRLLLEDFQKKKERHAPDDPYRDVVSRGACPSCQGLRLRERVLRLRCSGVPLAELLSMPLTQLEETAQRMSGGAASGPASPREELLAREVMPILRRQVRALINLGLGYLTLSRAVNTLSDGEHQRLRLASLLCNRLNFTLFVLDEASRGLHPHDVSSLLAALRQLLTGGNSLVAVDHHPLVAAEADWMIRLGPGSGQRGGRVVFMGKEPPATSPQIPIRAGAAPPQTEDDIVISAASVHNLRGLDLRIPGRGFSVLCGVSGSGKSTLLHRVIHESALAGRPLNCTAASGLDRFGRVHSFRPVNPTRGGNDRVLDLLGAATAVLDLFLRATGQQASRDSQRRLPPCPHCHGKGEWATDLDYLGSFVEPCAYCRGSGLAEEFSRLRLEGWTLADLLAGDLDAIPGELAARSRLERPLAHAREFALGHLSLGRRLASLSGGELQRLRLARLFMELGRGPDLLLLDEPDSGLGDGECRQLIAAIRQRTGQGHAAIVISHQPLLMGQADYIVDLGPGAGDDGGRLVACGAPRDLLAGDWPLSKTAAFLKTWRSGQ